MNAWAGFFFFFQSVSRESEAASRKEKVQVEPPAKTPLSADGHLNGEKRRKQWRPCPRSFAPILVSQLESLWAEVAISPTSRQLSNISFCLLSAGSVPPPHSPNQGRPPCSCSCRETKNIYRPPSPQLWRWRDGDFYHSCRLLKLNDCCEINTMLPSN